MKTKEQPGKKVLDISRPKARQAADRVPSAPSLVIPKRSVIQVTMSEAETETSVPEPVKIKSDTPRVQPISAPPVSPKPQLVSAAPPLTPSTVSVPAPEPEPEPTKPSPATVDPAPAPTPIPEPQQDAAPKQEAVSTPDTATTQPPVPPTPAEVPTEADESAASDTPQPPAPSNEQGLEHSTISEDPSLTAKSDKTSPEIRKALEDSKREEEIEGYITSHEFYVPINAVARKRSLRRSTALIFVELILGIALLNLMLDAGVIQLLEKIPHTNFFNLQ